MNRNHLPFALCLLTFLQCFFLSPLSAQEEDFIGGEADFSATFRKGQGLEVGFPSSGYMFGFTGLAQPGMNLSRSDADTTFALGTFTRRAYLTFKASDLERGIDVLVRANYIASTPIGYFARRGNLPIRFYIYTSVPNRRLRSILLPVAT